MKPTLSIYGIQDRFSGLPFHVHDHNICLMQDGKIITYLQLERYTRRKYDNRLPEFIEEIIDNKIIDLPDEFDLVNVNSFVGSCFISKNGRLRFESNKPKEVKTDLIKANAYFQKDKQVGFEINSYLLNHELAHIASNMPFFGEFKENSLLIHFDGGASLGNFSAFLFKNNKIQLIENHWELSEYSKFFNDNALAFAMINAKSSEHTSVPGKLMGFAAYGIYNHEIAEWLKENNYFKNIWNKPEIFIQSANFNFGQNIEKITTENKFIQDCASVFQYEFENAIFDKIKNTQEEYKTDYLYYSGGSALNILTNTKIVESNLFKDVFISPCCNDSGLSIGGASFLEWKKNEKIQHHSPYQNNFSLPKIEYNTDIELVNHIAKLLSENKIIAVSNNYAECGPRALGNRSILCLANNKELSQKVSMNIKKREWFRPVAPIMLEKNTKYFTEKNNIHHLSKLMLLDFKIPKHKQGELIGAVHANGTSRIQTIFSRNDNKFIYDLLTVLDEKYNIKALINTSFNIAGKPIVHTKEQSIKSAKEMNIDGLVLNYKFYNIAK